MNKTIDDGASDTESIYSIQDKETDYAKDTSDTDHEADDVNMIYSTESEQEVVENKGEAPSSSSEIMLAAAAAICAYASTEEWLTDGDSDSCLDDSRNWSCVKCQSRKDNPSFLYCTKCFQDKKEMRPPRPKQPKKKIKSTTKPACQDSGLGSSQDFDLLKSETSQSESLTRRKRQISESSLSDTEVRRSKRQRLSKNYSQSSPELRKSTDLCIACNVEEKNSVFIHGKTGHKSCCYKCAMRTWRTIKRCPVCNRRVNNIVQIFAV